MLPKPVGTSLYPSEKVGPNGLKVVSAEECPMVSSQRVKEVNEIGIPRHCCGVFLQGRVWKGRGEVGLNVMVMPLLKGQSCGVSKVVVGCSVGFGVGLALGCGLLAREVWALDEEMAKL